MRATEELKQAIRDSLDDYANRLQGQDRRGLMMTDYHPPDELDGVGYQSKEMEKAMHSWELAMQQWREKYGSTEGWTEFTNWWKFTPNSIPMKQAYFGARFQEVRDNFGYATEDTLYSTRAEDIARGLGQHESIWYKKYPEHDPWAKDPNDPDYLKNQKDNKS